LAPVNFLISIAKNAYLKLLVISVIMIVATLDSLSQSRYLKFSHLTVDDGLSSNRIRCILKDSKMYLWLATDIGLDKYDSYQVKQYRNNKKQPGTISSDIVK